MAILTKRETWAKPRPADETRRSTDLTPAEQENVRVALRFLAKRLGGYRKLSTAMRAKHPTVRGALGRGNVSAGLAVRAARLAGVPVEDVLAGRWPVEGARPYCGRSNYV
jgi:hypothetical protein